MSKALVAKSYENLEQVGEVYTVNGRTYIKVRTKKGELKQVRAYSQKEYEKYNPPVTIIQPAKSRKDVFGFGEAGYIWIFLGETYENLQWFHISPCRYNRVWGWYLPSSEEMPEPLPANVKTMKLFWDTVSRDNQLLPEAELTKVVDNLIYEPGKSQFVGEIGDRIEFDGICSRATATETMYGTSYFFVFEDENENVYTWNTTARSLEEGCRYHIRGSVKEHKVYRNNNQTVLQRCKVEEID